MLRVSDGRPLELTRDDLLVLQDVVDGSAEEFDAGRTPSALVNLQRVLHALTGEEMPPRAVRDAALRLKDEPDPPAILAKIVPFPDIGRVAAVEKLARKPAPAEGPRISRLQAKLPRLEEHVVVMLEELVDSFLADDNWKGGA